MSEPANPSALTTERLFSATPQRIFAAFRQPELLAQWWGPTGFTNTFHQFDFTPGGRWVFTMHGPNGSDYANECLFRTIEPSARLVIEHIPKPWFLLTVTLTPRGQQTLLHWNQLFESPQAAAALRALVDPSNEQVLDRLEALLAKQTP